MDAFNRRDADLIADLTTPDFEWFPALPGNVEGGGYRGREGIETYLGEIRDTWEELRVVGDEFRDLGDACSCSVEPRDVEEVAARQSMRRTRLLSNFAATRYGASARISITARRCE